MSKQTDEQLALLQQAMENRSLCAVNRDMIDYLSIYGYPLAMSDKLVALRFVYDFAPDGIKIVRTQDITEVFCGDVEAFNDHIVKNEFGDLDLSVPHLNLFSVKSLCADLLKSEQTVAIDCEGYEESQFYVGKIVALEDKCAKVLCFDGLGVWDKEAMEVEYKKITCISIGSRYVNTISKYLK